MKKFLCALMVGVLPLGLLVGCGPDSNLTKISTHKSGPDFMCMITDKLDTFYGNVEKKMITQADVVLPEDSSPEDSSPEDEQNPEDGAEDETEKGFDFSEITQDTEAQKIWSTDIWAMADKTNKENMFALLAYDIYEKNEDFGYYDLSFLSTKTDKALSDFFVQKTTTNGSTRVFVTQLSGLEDPALNLPVPIASNAELVDRADDVIKQWGNYMYFTGKTADVAINIKVSTAFEYPHESDITPTLSNTGIEYRYLADTDSVVLVYEQQDGLTYSKLVTFTEQQDGTIKKVVKKFVGNYIEDPNLSGGQEYEYSLEVDESVPYDICCDYTITYSGADGGIFCQQKRENNSFTWAEYYLVKSGEVVGRIKQSDMGERTTIDFLINRDLVTGSLKYNFQRTSVGKTNSSFLRDERKLHKHFCDITADEAKLAKSNTALNVMIVKFHITEEKFDVTSATEV